MKPEPLRQLDRLAISGMMLSVVIMLQPWWAGGLRAGFFGSLVFTLLHIYTSHARSSQN